MSLAGIPPSFDPIESKRNDDEKFIDPEEDFLKPQIPETGDPFGNEEGAEVKYKTLKWWYVLRTLTWITRF